MEEFLINKAIFLDRDGVINKDIEYLDDYNKFIFLPKVFDAIRLLNQNGYKVIIITNQSGVARGFFTEEKLNLIHEKMTEDIQKNNARIDSIYYCPHHPDFGSAQYKKDCECRKPKIGLILKAKKDFNIDLSHSFFVGDKITDIVTGVNARCKTILISDDSKKSKSEIETMNLKVDYITKDLFDAVTWILNY
ncbi:MAG: D-glycero-beta-D-manno-heptose 1,7-bisphosphate 7-phosphatase [Candidatus Lokiarchaeota archaeon]|nr:D-glycero-beta-D-manno-heptose 1,7-bisphosphate 7-phosphatase [Candidatus Lokiarchaeota archaeon]